MDDPTGQDRRANGAAWTSSYRTLSSRGRLTRWACLLTAAALLVGVVAGLGGRSAATSRISSMSHTRSGHPSLTVAAAKRVLADYSAGLEAANAAADPAKLRAVAGGAAAAEIDAQYHVDRAFGGSYLTGLRGTSTALVDPRFAIPTADAYPRYFAVTAGGGLFSSKARGALLFQELEAGKPWKLISVAQLGTGQRLPALDKALAVPLTGPAAGARLGGTTLAGIVQGQLTESMNPASGAACPGPVPGIDKTFALTGLFTEVVSTERKDCASFDAHNVGLEFDWDTTRWSVVSFPTNAGGTVSFLALDQHVVESPPSASQSLTCSPRPTPCGVYLSPSGHYPELNLDYLVQFFVVTSKIQKHAQSLDLIGLDNEIVDVTDAGL